MTALPLNNTSVFFNTPTSPSSLGRQGESCSNVSRPPCKDRRNPLRWIQHSSQLAVPSRSRPLCRRQDHRRPSSQWLTCGRWRRWRQPVYGHRQTATQVSATLARPRHCACNGVCPLPIWSKPVLGTRWIQQRGWVHCASSDEKLRSPLERVTCLTCWQFSVRES